MGWEKALVTLEQDTDWEAMGRLEVPRKLLTAVKALYVDPTGKVERDGTEHTWYKQARGIRQRCPFSLDRCVIVTHVTFPDIHYQDSVNVNEQRVPGTDWGERLYAGNMVLVASGARALNRPIAKLDSTVGITFNNGV